jgi:hypothetical protein
MSTKIYYAVLEEIYNNVVRHFNLLQSFNYTTYLYKKRFKSEINSFCIWTQLTDIERGGGGREAGIRDAYFPISRHFARNADFSNIYLHVILTLKPLKKEVHIELNDLQDKKN